MPENTLAKRWLNKIKNHPISASIIVAVTILFSVTDTVNKLFEATHKSCIYLHICESPDDKKFKSNLLSSYLLGRSVSKVSYFATELPENKIETMKSQITTPKQKAELDEIIAYKRNAIGEMEAHLKILQIDVDISNLDFADRIIINYQESSAAHLIGNVIRDKFGTKAAELFRYGEEYEAYYHLASTNKLDNDPTDPIFGGFMVYERLFQNLKDIGGNTAGLMYPDNLPNGDLDGMNRSLKILFSSMDGRYESKLRDNMNN